jgi:integrase
VKIRRSISFYLERRIKDGVRQTKDLRIRMRIAYDSKTIEIPLSCRIDENKWDAENCQALPKAKDKYGNTTRDINSEIEAFKDSAEKAFAKFELIEGRMPEKEELKKVFNEISGRKNKGTEKKELASEVFSKFIREGMSSWTSGTYKKMRTVSKHLHDYNKDLLVSDMGSEFLKEYAKHLIDNLKFRNSTVLKQIRLIRWFLNWATENGIETNSGYKTHKLRLKNAEKKVIFLTWDELMVLNDYSFGIPGTTAENVRDVFCFCCFTSLRYSDVNNLYKHNVYDNYIEVVTVKTDDPIKIELNKYSKAILDKYKDIPIKNGKALPVISNQKMNKHLKKICEAAGINSSIQTVYYEGSKRIETVSPKHELITTHCARRTFICNALAMGIPPHVVMKWTGHSTYSSMKPYIGVADTSGAEFMKKFDE